MYDTQADYQKGESLGRCKEPDWEKEYAEKKKNLDGIAKFKFQLLDFIKLVGTHSFRRDGKNQMAEFLGTIEIDMMQRNQELNRIAALIEKKS